MPNLHRVTFKDLQKLVQSQTDFHITVDNEASADIKCEKCETIIIITLENGELRTSTIQT